MGYGKGDLHGEIVDPCMYGAGGGGGRGKGHTTNKRPSNRQKHEEGDARRQQDRGGEKGDAMTCPR
jgi:hypothetical protein